MAMSYTNEQVTRVCYEATRAIQAVAGDHTIPAWDAAPAWAWASMAAQVSAVLDGKARTPEALHDIWVARMKEMGWRHGNLRAPERLEHPWLCGLAELPGSAWACYQVVIALVGALASPPAPIAEVVPVKEVEPAAQVPTTEPEAAKAEAAQPQSKKRWRKG